MENSGGSGGAWPTPTPLWASLSPASKCRHDNKGMDNVIMASISLLNVWHAVPSHAPHMLWCKNTNKLESWLTFMVPGNIAETIGHGSLNTSKSVTHLQMNSWSPERFGNLGNHIQLSWSRAMIWTQETDSTMWTDSMVDACSERTLGFTVMKDSTRASQMITDQTSHDVRGNGDNRS